MSTSNTSQANFPPSQPRCITEKTPEHASHGDLETFTCYRPEPTWSLRQCQDHKPQQDVSSKDMGISLTTQPFCSSCWQALSLRSCACASSINANCELEAEEVDLTRRTLRRRPCMSDMQRFKSSPEVYSYTRVQQKKQSDDRKGVGRRCVSANPALTSDTTFTTPNRYTASRSLLSVSASPLRTNHHPSSLGVYERKNRHADSNVSTFRSTTEDRPSRTVQRPAPSRLRLFQPPHYTPSFAHRREQPTVHDDARPEHGPVRHTSVGSVWRVGGRVPSNGRRYGVELGNGFMTASGTNAPIVESSFPSHDIKEAQNVRHERRLALALDIDVSQRILPVCLPVEQARSVNRKHDQYQWINGGWTLHNLTKAAIGKKLSVTRPEKAVPTIAFRVLDAPRLKDDYYCSVLAYCRVFRTLAVALMHRVYLWTEKYGVRYPPLTPARQGNYVTCLTFSSDDGGRAILATSRHSGDVTLWSLLEQKARFEIPHPSTACSVAFRPTISKRMCPNSDRITDCEDLLVGDDMGRIYFYSIDWPKDEPGSVSLLAKVEAHSQNVCGLAWAPDGKSFVSGGNDNRAMLFVVKDIFRLQRLAGSASSQRPSRPRTDAISTSLRSRPSSANDGRAFASSLRSRSHRRTDVRHTDRNSHGSSVLQPTLNVHYDRDRPQRPIDLTPRRAPPTPPRSPTVRSITSSNELADPSTTGITNACRHSFYHSAAVKAVAFAPWQSTLLATSGGSNDRQIHFHHTETGTTLAVINVHAQVTSLVWSLTRREIAATFGYAQPEHEIRIAVFAWPSCECVISIPWERKPNGEIGRALWAIPYPGGPNSAAPERLQEDGEAYEYWETRQMRSVQTPTTTRDPGNMSSLPTPDASPERHANSTDHTRIQNFTRGEGETWASRTEEEGSLIIACCDQTVKFFEVWAGKSKGRSCGIGSKAGVFGGSKVLEGWCEGIAIEEVGAGEDVIQ